MRKFRAALVAAAFGIAALGSSALVTTSADAAPHKGTLTAPCAKAKSAKLGGGFMCDLIYVPKDKADAIVAKAATAGSLEAALAAGGTGSGLCHISGCYDWFSDHHVGYSAVGDYGWRYSDGAYQRIGTVTININDYTVSQYSTKIAFCWKSTASTWATYHVVERYYATAGTLTNGPLTTRRGIESVGRTLTRNELYTYCLPATGNHDYAGNVIGNTMADSTSATGTIYHYVTWRSGQGFSGKYYAYAKAPIFYRINATEWLHFYTPMKIPLNDANAGWLPN